MIRKQEGRVDKPAAQLGILPVVSGALGFSLRHIVAFFLLGLLVNLPTYLHSFLPREVLNVGPGPNWPEGQAVPELLLLGWELPRARWETEFAIPLIEMMLLGIAAAVMTQTRLRDRRGEDWTVFPALAGTLRHWWTVLGVGVLCGVASAGTQYMSDLIPLTAFLLVPLFLAAALMLCTVMPCAAVFNVGVIDCLERGAELTDGSRLRILAIYVLLIAIALGVAITAGLVLEYGLGIKTLDISPMWRWFAASLVSAYFIPLLAIIHEALVALKDGPDPKSQAATFD